MMKRRTVFATPFVVVVGCGHPVVPPAPAPLRPEAEAVVDSQQPLADAAPDVAMQVVSKERVIYWRPHHGDSQLEITGASSSIRVSSLRAVFIDENGHIAGPEIAVRYVSPDTGQLFCTVARDDLPSRDVEILEPAGTAHDEPPPSACRPRPGHTCNPPKPQPAVNDPIDTWPTDVRRTGGATVVTLPVGSYVGIHKDWTVAVIGDHGETTTILCPIKRLDGDRLECVLAVSDLVPHRLRLSRP